MDARETKGDPGDRGPMDPTRKLLKVFGVKVTDYESKTDELLARWPSADERDRAAIQGEALEHNLASGLWWAAFQQSWATISPAGCVSRAARALQRRRGC